MVPSQTIKVFLASSLTELKDERVVLADYINNTVAPILKNADLHLNLFKCEDDPSGNYGGSSQKSIDEELKESDVSVFLFKKKAGEKTLREFDLAREIQKTRKLEVYVYCYEVPDSEKSQELVAFQQQLEKEEFYWETFESIDAVKSRLLPGLLKHIFGEKAVSDALQISVIEKDGDECFKEYESNEKIHVQLRNRIHQNVEDLLKQIEITMSDDNTNIAIRIATALELYQKADLWASKTDYNKSKHISFLLKYGEFVFKYGIYNDAENVFMHYAELVKETKGIDNTDYALACSKIGSVFDCKQDYPSALKYHRIALKIRVKVLGHNDLSTADSYIHLGIIYSEKNMNRRAIFYFLKALHIRKKQLGKDSPSLSRDYNNIGWLFCIQDMYNIALLYLHNSLRLLDESDEITKPYVYNNLGFAYLAIKNLKDALNYLKESIKIRELRLGNKHPDTAESYINIGYLYEKMGNDELSIAFYRKALELPCEQIKPIHHKIRNSTNWNKVVSAVGNDFEYTFLMRNWR